MAGAHTGEVIKYFRRKDSTDFEPISWLGSEQRFVSGLRNGNINNLEEQFVLGTDSYTEMYDDERGNHIIEKNFCITSIDEMGNPDLDERTEYYKVVTTIYSNSMTSVDYYFDADSVILTDRNNDVLFGDGDEYPDIDSLYLLDNETFEWFDIEDLKIHPTGYYTSRKDELYFIKQGEPDLLVLTKTTTKKIDRNGRVYIRKHIENALTP